MSIGWTTINPVLCEIVTECAIDRTRPADAFKAEWKEGPVSFINPDQNQAVQLKVTRVGELGEDETRTTEELVDGETVVTETQSGQRKVTLQIQAIVPEHTDEQWAMATLERIRMRLRRPRVIERLLDLDVSIIGILDAVKASFKDRGRVMSAGTMDVVLGAVASEDDPVRAGWIQYLVISSHVKDTDGTVLAAGQQMVNVEVPTIP